MMIIEYDFHNHTNFSVCANKDATIETIIREYERQNFKSIGISDHYYPDKPVDKYVKKIREELSEIKTNLNVYIGMEVDMFSPGKLVATREELAGLDYIAVACPHYQNSKVVLPISNDYTVIAQNALDYFLSAAAIRFIDIIVHPFEARALSKYIPDFELPEMMKKLSNKEYMQIIELLLENNIAVELTERLRQSDYFRALYPFLTFCRDNGVKFSLGSDSHAPGHIGSIRKAAQAIEELKIRPEHLWHPDGQNKT